MSEQSANARREAAILAVAIHGEKVVASDSEGCVLTFSFDAAVLTVERVLYEDPKAPIAALASDGEHIVGAGESLFVWTPEGAVVATARLPAVAIDVALRRDGIFVLGGGKVLRFERAGDALRATGEWKHSQGDASELDVDDKGKRAVVVVGRTTVNLLGLGEDETATAWKRKGKVDDVSLRFSRDGKSLLSVTDGDSRLSRVKDTTGRVTGELLRLHDMTNGPMVFDVDRRVVAVTGTGQDLEVVEIDPPRSIFLLHARLTSDRDKVMSYEGIIPRFAVAPQLYLRRPSLKAAAVPPSTQTARAVGKRGDRVVVGFLSGEILAADTRTGLVASTHRGVLGEARCVARFPFDWVDAGHTRTGDEVWFLGKSGQFVVVDLGKREIREDVRVSLDGDRPSGHLEIGSDTITFMSLEHATIFSRKDGSIIHRQPLPAHRGGRIEGTTAIFLPLDTLGPEGFDIVAVDLVSGERRVLSHFVRDEQRFPIFPRDPKGWVRFYGSSITIEVLEQYTVRRSFLFDPKTGTVGAEVPFNPDGDFPSERVGDEIVIRSAATKAVVAKRRFEKGEGTSGKAAYDPTSGVVVAEVDDAHTGVWDGAGNRRCTLHGHLAMQRIWIRSDGKVAAIRDKYTLRIWDIS